MTSTLIRKRLVLPAHIYCVLSESDPTHEKPTSNVACQSLVRCTQSAIQTIHILWSPRLGQTNRTWVLAYEIHITVAIKVHTYCGNSANFYKSGTPSPYSNVVHPLESTTNVKPANTSSDESSPHPLWLYKSTPTVAHHRSTSSQVHQVRTMDDVSPLETSTKVIQTSLGYDVQKPTPTVAFKVHTHCGTPSIGCKSGAPSPYSRRFTSSVVHEEGKTNELEV